MNLNSQIANQFSSESIDSGKNNSQEFDLKPVETIALTGLYGSGKSTQANSIIQNSDEEHVFIGSETADIGMDGGSIDLPEERIVELYNICMACNPEGEFDETVTEEEVLEVLEESDRAMTEGPGNAGTRDLAGTLSSVPVLEPKYVGRMINLENWEAEKSELSYEDLAASNFVIVNRPTAEHSAENVKDYIEDQGAEVEVLESSPEDPITMEDLDKVDEWTEDLLVESMGPGHLLNIKNGESNHDHKDTSYGKIDPEINLQDINEALLSIPEEDYTGVRIKLNVGEYFVNIVNGDLQVEECDKRAPAYLAASNFGEIPESINSAFEELETLESQFLRAGATAEEAKSNLEAKYENARQANPIEIAEEKDSMIEMPDPVGSAYKTAREASEIWPDDTEIHIKKEDIAEEYARSALKLIGTNKQREAENSYDRKPLVNAKLAAELHWASKDAHLATETGKRIAAKNLQESLEQFDESHVEEVSFYSDKKDFHEYFTHILSEGYREGSLDREDVYQTAEHMGEVLKSAGLEEDAAEYWNPDEVVQ